MSNLKEIISVPRVIKTLGKFFEFTCDGPLTDFPFDVRNTPENYRTTKACNFYNQGKPVGYFQLVKDLRFVHDEPLYLQEDLRVIIYGPIDGNTRGDFLQSNSTKKSLPSLLLSINAKTQYDSAALGHDRSVTFTLYEGANWGNALPKLPLWLWKKNAEHSELAIMAKLIQSNYMIQLNNS